MTAPKLPPPLKPETRKALDRVRAQRYSLKGFKAFCKLLILPKGQPMKVYGFQAFMLALHFAGVIELVILIPKKNGKTTLLAALALYHLLMVEGADVFIGAAAKDQASIIFEQAAGFVFRSGLEEVFDVRGGYRIIRRRGTIGRIRVLAAEVDTVDGVIPTLALVDELHRHRSSELYGVFRDGIEGAQGQMVTISTAGSSMDSALGVLLERARGLSTEREGWRRTYRTKDGSFALVEWALTPEDNPDDLSIVKKVNPAPWHTIERLRLRHDSPSMTTGQWLRFACGIWTAGDEPAVQAKEWDPQQVDIGKLVKGDRVWLAPSVGDNAAIGIASMRPDDRVAVGAVVLERREGHSLLRDVEEACLQLAKTYRVVAFISPERAFERSADFLEDSGLTREMGVWSPQRKISATGSFLRMLREGSVLHDGDPILRQHVLSMTLRAFGGEEYMDVTRFDRAACAVAMATHYAAANDYPAPRIHVYKGA